MNLDCTSGSVTVPCPDDGLVVGYAGNATITTTCAGISWATGHPAGGTPNEVVFTPSAPIVIAANTFPFCSIQFNVQILGPSNDTTPNVAEEVAGYNGTSSDAQYDNALSSSVSQAGTIPLCVCNDGDPCTLDTCDHDTGSCTFTPTTCATTTTPSTTTTLMHGCVPPTPDALKCEKAIANALATLVKNFDRLQHRRGEEGGRHDRRAVGRR